MSKTTVLELATHRQLLDKIVHLAQISAPVIFVSGDEGSGKTTLCQQILEQNAPQVLCAYFCCSTTSTSGAARKSLITQIFPKAIFNENDPLEESITRLVQVPTDIVFILDNGHEASSELLLDLWAVKRHLYQSNRQISLTIIITALPQWCDMQIAVLREQGVSAAEFALPPLSLKEARLFLEYTLVDKQGHTGSIFMQSVTDSILLSCYGNPAQLKKLAENLMHDPKEHETLIHPWQKVAVGVVVMAGVALIFSWVLPIVPQKMPENVPTNVPTNVQTSVIKTEQKPQTIESLMEEGPSTVVGEQEKTPTIEAENSQEVQKDISLQEKTLEEPQISSDIQIDVPVDEARLEPELLQAPSVQDVTRIAENEAEIVAPEQPAPETAVPEQTVYTQAITDLSQKNADYYTVQLVGLSQQEQAHLFVEQHKLQDSSTIYEIQRQGQPFFIVVMGEYATQVEAKAALNALPDVLKKHKPWPKSFAQIQREVQS